MTAQHRCIILSLGHRRCRGDGPRLQRLLLRLMDAPFVWASLAAPFPRMRSECCRGAPASNNTSCVRDVFLPSRSRRVREKEKKRKKLARLCVCLRARTHLGVNTRGVTLCFFFSHFCSFFRTSIHFHSLISAARAAPPHPARAVGGRLPPPAKTDSISLALPLILSAARVAAFGSPFFFFFFLLSLITRG